MSEVAPYLAILVGAALPTQMWRWLGVLLAGRLDETSPLFDFVKAVATALVAAVIADLILNPSGPLASSPVALRVGAAVAGFAAYLAFGQRLVVGIAAAEGALIGGWLLVG